MTADSPTQSALREQLDAQIEELVAAVPPATTERLTFLKARYDAGLAWVHFPHGHGGRGIPASYQAHVERRLADFGAPDNQPRRNSIGLGM